MACGGSDRPPSYASRFLIEWVRYHWNTLDGDSLYRTGRGLDSMSVRELCNLAYRSLAEGRDRVQMAELEEMLADPSEKEKVRAKVSAESMAALAAGGFGPIMPPKAPVRG